MGIYIYEFCEHKARDILSILPQLPLRCLTQGASWAMSVDQPERLAVICMTVRAHAASTRSLPRRKEAVCASLLQE
jgi:hypothetical protein